MHIKGQYCQKYIRCTGALNQIFMTCFSSCGYLVSKQVIIIYYLAFLLCVITSPAAANGPNVLHIFLLVSPSHWQ